MREQAENAIQSATAFNAVSELSMAGIGGTFKGAAALYNAMFNQPASNNRMEARRLKTIIATFQQDHGLTQDMSVMLMRTVSDRINTIIPGLIIADVLARRFQSKIITYSDSGVREGYIYDQIIGNKK